MTNNTYPEGEEYVKHLKYKLADILDDLIRQCIQQHHDVLVEHYGLKKVKPIRGISVPDSTREKEKIDRTVMFAITTDLDTPQPDDYHGEPVIINFDTMDFKIFPYSQECSGSISRLSKIAQREMVLEYLQSCHGNLTK